MVGNMNNQHPYGHTKQAFVNIRDYLSSLIVSQCCPFAMQLLGHPSSFLHTWNISLSLHWWLMMFIYFPFACILHTFAIPLSFINGIVMNSSLLYFLWCLFEIPFPSDRVCRLDKGEGSWWENLANPEEAFPQPLACRLLLQLFLLKHSKQIPVFPRTGEGDGDCQDGNV